MEDGPRSFLGLPLGELGRMQSLKTCGQAIVGLMVWAIIIGVGIAVCQNMNGEPDPSSPAATPTRTRAPVPTTAKAAADKCLSAWDGSHRGTNELIKADLVSPDSFEHVETRYRTALMQGGRILQLEVTFSAENAFGARLRGIGVGDVDVRTCRAVAGGVLG